jgi:hypothetical protein
METKKIDKRMVSTNDHVIRIELRQILEKELEQYRSESGRPANIFEELGVSHGKARIDIAVVNGVMHGYEIKSDRDTLSRLFEQMHEYNAVFDKITLVVGQRHLLDAIYQIPEWWGITLVKINTEQQVAFYSIREARDNENKQVPISIARLLWRAEALKILEERNEADGVRSKPREFIHEKLAEVLKDDVGTLKEHVRNALLVSRGDWRSVAQPLSSGD